MGTPVGDQEGRISEENVFISLDPACPFTQSPIRGPSPLLYFPLQPTDGSGFQLSLATGCFTIPSWFSSMLVVPL